MPSIFITREWPGPYLDTLQQAGFHVNVWPDFEAPSEEELAARASSSDILMTTVEDRVSRRVLEAGRGTLRAVTQSAVGFDNVDLEAARDLGIRVTNTPGVLDDATADLAFALMCTVSRQIVDAHRYTTDGNWTCWHPALFLGLELHQATVGIVGMGRIGSAFAQRCAGFDMEILYTDRTTKQSSVSDARQVDLETLLKRSDIVSLHVPLNPATEKLIDDRAIRLMKRDSVLVNTSRGRIVDTMALVNAIDEHRLGGAGLDVTDPEPIPAGHPLLSLPNVVVTPHIGSAGRQTRSDMATMAASNAIAIMGDKHPINPVV